MTINKEMLACRWGTFSDLGQLAAQPLQDGRFCVTVDAGHFECLFERSGERRLFVLLSGARDPATQPMPKFDRWSWSDMYPGSVLCIADPTLALDAEKLRIGWYVGTAEHDWLRSMAVLVRGVAARLDVAPDQIICYGSSAGGFGAMMLAAELGTATAVAINPQTQVARYSARFVGDLLDVAFGGRTIDSLSEAERLRLSAIERFKRAPAARCLIAQNVQDDTHFRAHYTPFCEALGVPLGGGADPSGRIVSLVFDSPLGHGPEPKELAPELIRRSLALLGADQLHHAGPDKQTGTSMEAANLASLQAPTNGSVTIRTLRITGQPVWIDVENETLAELELHARVRGWPADSRATAIVMFELAEGISTEELKAHGISHSATGPYVYLDHHVQDGVFSWKVTIPRAWVRRIGFRLWAWPEPILLEQLELTSRGGTLAPHTAARQVALFDDGAQTEDDVLSVDLLDDKEECGPRCVAKCKNWYVSMDQYQNKSPNADLGRSDCFYATGEHEYALVSAFHAQPAMLAITQTIDDYAHLIGDKSRNMVRKAVRAGYKYVAVDPNAYIDDIVAIRTSAPIRQGKEIPAYFRERPNLVLAKQRCQYHGDGFYGVFKDDTLVAYVTLYFYGQLAQVNHLLGHADYLSDGIMNLLMYEVVNDLITNRPWVHAINYMYAGSATAASGTALFKRSMGFEPRRLMMAHGDPTLAQVLDARRAQKRQAALAAESQKVRVKVAPKIESAELDEAMLTGSAASRDEALECVLGAGMGDAASRPYRFRFGDDDGDCVSAALQSAPMIVVDGVDTLNIVKFLSAGFKQFRNSVAKGAFLAFDFPRNVAAPLEGTEQVDTPPVDSDLLQPTIDYFRRRFKSTAPGVDAVRDGFKGSDFVVRGIVDYADDDGAVNHCMLLLKKIR